MTRGTSLVLLLHLLHVSYPRVFPISSSYLSFFLFLRLSFFSWSGLVVLSGTPFLVIVFWFWFDVCPICSTPLIYHLSLYLYLFSVPFRLVYYGLSLFLSYITFHFICHLSISPFLSLLISHFNFIDLFPFPPILPLSLSLSFMALPTHSSIYLYLRPQNFP